MKNFVKISLLLAILLPLTAAAYDFEVDGIYYKIDGSNATVTYQGEIYWQSHYHYTGDVNIPSTVTYNGVTYSVTAIDEYAFFGSNTMTSVTIPESITKIGRVAFGRCDGLTNVTIPSSVTSIGRGLFHYCYGLNSISVESGNTCYDSRDNCNAIIETATNTLITGCKSSIIPNTVTTIGEEAFQYCIGLTGDLNIPNSVTKIGSDSFYGCTGLTSVTIPNSVTSINSYAFYGCTGLTKVNIFDIAAWCNIEFYGQNANPLLFVHHLFLNGVEIKDLVIPNSVTEIGNYAFWGCTDLTSVTIPNSVTRIGLYAFSNCSSLTSITIPESITLIGVEAFSGCTGLTSVTICGNTSGLRIFKGCPAIETVIVRRASPPDISEDFFDEVIYQSATLHVPSGGKIFFEDHEVWNKFADIVEEDMPDVEIDSSPFNNLYSRRLILSYTSREDGGGSWAQPGAAEIVQAVKFPVERMSRIEGNEITHIRFNLWGRYEHVSNLKVFIGSTRDKRDLACQSVANLHEGWNEVALNEPYLITGDSIFVGVEYLKGAEDMLCPVMWDPYAGNEEGACLAIREGKWESDKGTWYIQCLVEGDQVPKYDLHFEELVEPLYNRAVKASEPFNFQIKLRNWGSMPIERYEMKAQLDGTDIECSPRWSTTIKRGGGLQEISLKVIPSEGTPPGCYQLSVTPQSLNDVEYTSVEAPLVTPMKVYEHDMGRQKVLVQVYSGTWCGYCPGFDSLVEQKRQERDDLAVVSIHSRDKYSTPVGSSYLSMQYTDGIPDVDLNRCVEKTPYNYREYRMNYELDRAKAQPAFATVKIRGSFNEENHVLDLAVSGERNEDFLPVEGWTNLTVLLVEDEVIGAQLGYDGSDYHHPAVLRAALSDVWGDPVQWNGDKYEMHYSMSMDELANSDLWNIENMRVVAFLGKPFTGNNYEEIGVVNCNEYRLYDPYLGDVNGDHEVNIADINAVIGMILSGTPEESGDANRDGEVNIADINVIIKAILNR